MMYLLLLVFIAAFARGQNIVELAVGTPTLSTLASAVTSAGLVDTLTGDDPFTVFAPTNAAFSGVDTASLTLDQLSAVLTYHVVAGKVLSTDLFDGQVITTVNGAKLSVSVADGAVSIANDDGAVIAKLVAKDVRASNGVVHIIDAVFIPGKNIVDLAVQAAPELTTLVGAVDTAGLVDTLTGDGPFTVFAPTNAAFNGVDTASLDQDELSAVLTYHVVAGKVLSTDLKDGQEIPTVNGASLFVSFEGTVLHIQNAKVNPTVVARINPADIRASNGVVHIIDRVLIPPEPPTPCADKDQPICLKSRHWGWPFYYCKVAKHYCHHKRYGASARHCCPKSCDVCDEPIARALDSEDAAGPGLVDISSVAPGMSDGELVGTSVGVTLAGLALLFLIFLSFRYWCSRHRSFAESKDRLGQKAEDPAAVI